MKIICEMLKYLGPPLPGYIKSDTDRVILSFRISQTCNKIGIIPEGSISTWLLRGGNGNAQAQRTQALLLSVPRVNNNVDMDTEDFIPFIT